MEKKEAMKILKDFHDKSALFSVRTALDTIIPGLKESEDEKIRKELIKHLKDGAEGYMPAGDSEDYARWLAWLEKQGKETSEKEFTFKALPRLLEMIEVSDRAKAYTEKLAVALDNEGYHTDAKIVRESIKIMNGEEVPMATMDEQKPVDNIEPKFKVGDFIVNDYCFGKVIEITNDAYLLDTGQGIPFSYEHNAHLWTINDAKDGDVLASELCDSIILFRGIKDDNIDFYCDYDFSKIDIPGDRFTVNNGQHYGNVEDSKDFYPVTKEQRDTLLKAMAEAGYEWDDEKKELKKIEQKSQRLVSAEAKEALYDKPTDEEMKELLRTEYEKGRADTLSEMKSSWSEEDERICRNIVNDIANDKSICKYEMSKRICDEQINWLKSIKQRIE